MSSTRLFARMLIATVTSVSTAFCTIPTCPTGTPPSFPSYTNNLDVSGNTGTYFSYYNGSRSETPGATLASYSPLTIPGGTGSAFGTGAGYFASATYYNAYPWVVNSTGGPTPSTSCTPGVNCNSCNSTSGVVDCTGYPIPRSPAIFIQSPHFTSSRGFEFRGRFNGQATLPGGTGLADAVYFHDSQVYYGYSEYGFFRNLNDDPNQRVVYFYWAINSNCGNSSFVMCTDTQGNRGSSHLVYTDSPTAGVDYPAFGVTSAACQMSFDATQDYIYDVQIFDQGSGNYVFGVRILDPNNGNANVVSPMVIDANSATFTSNVYFPTDWLTSAGPHAPANEGGGYITVGVARSDPSNGQGYSAVPSVAVSTIAVAP